MSNGCEFQGARFALIVIEHYDWPWSLSDQKHRFSWNEIQESSKCFTKWKKDWSFFVIIGISSKVQILGLILKAHYSPQKLPLWCLFCFGLLLFSPNSYFTSSINRGSSRTKLNASLSVSHKFIEKGYHAGMLSATGMKNRNVETSWPRWSSCWKWLMLTTGSMRNMKNVR